MAVLNEQGVNMKRVTLLIILVGATAILAGGQAKVTARDAGGVEHDTIGRATRPSASRNATEGQAVYIDDGVCNGECRPGSGGNGIDYR